MNIILSTFLEVYINWV